MCCSLSAINFGMLDNANGESSTSPYDAVLIIGIVTVLNAAFNCFVLCTHPAFKVKQAPPRGELTQDVRLSLCLVPVLVHRGGLWWTIDAVFPHTSLFSGIHIVIPCPTSPLPTSP